MKYYLDDLRINKNKIFVVLFCTLVISILLSYLYTHFIYTNQVNIFLFIFNKNDNHYILHTHFLESFSMFMTIFTFSIGLNYNYYLNKPFNKYFLNIFGLRGVGIIFLPISLYIVLGVYFEYAIILSTVTIFYILLSIEIILLISLTFKCGYTIYDKSLFTETISTIDYIEYDDNNEDIIFKLDKELSKLKNYKLCDYKRIIDTRIKFFDIDLTNNSYAINRNDYILFHMYIGFVYKVLTTGNKDNVNIVIGYNIRNMYHKSNFNILTRIFTNKTWKHLLLNEDENTLKFICYTILEKNSPNFMLYLLETTELSDEEKIECYNTIFQFILELKTDLCTTIEELLNKTHNDKYFFSGLIFLYYLTHIKDKKTESHEKYNIQLEKYISNFYYDQDIIQSYAEFENVEETLLQYNELFSHLKMMYETKSFQNKGSSYYSANNIVMDEIIYNVYKPIVSAFKMGAEYTRDNMYTIVDIYCQIRLKHRIIKEKSDFKFDELIQYYIANDDKILKLEIIKDSVLLINNFYDCQSTKEEIKKLVKKEIEFTVCPMEFIGYDSGSVKEKQTMLLNFNSNYLSQLETKSLNDYIEVTTDTNTTQYYPIYIYYHEVFNNFSFDETKKNKLVNNNYIRYVAHMSLIAENKTDCNKIVSELEHDTLEVFLLELSRIVSNKFKEQYEIELSRELIEKFEEIKIGRSIKLLRAFNTFKLHLEYNKNIESNSVLHLLHSWPDHMNSGEIVKIFHEHLDYLDRKGYYYNLSTIYSIINKLLTNLNDTQETMSCDIEKILSLLDSCIKILIKNGVVFLLSGKEVYKMLLSNIKVNIDSEQNAVYKLITILETHLGLEECVFDRNVNELILTILSKLAYIKDIIENCIDENK